MRFGKIGLEADCPSIERDGLVRSPIGQQSVGQIVVRFQQIRFERDGLPIGGDRLARFSGTRERIAEAVICFGKVGPLTDRSPGQFHGLSESASLSRQHAQEIQGICMIGLLYEDVTIDPLRFGNAAGLVM